MMEMTPTILFASPQLMTLPLSLGGTVSGLTVRKPTWTEVNDFQQHDVTHLQMTSDAIWNPNDPDYNHQESAFRAAVLDPHTVPSRHVHSTQMRGLRKGDPEPCDRALFLPSLLTFV